ncbi:MAG TPA: FtsX-like permease family protein, partial [Gemmatimonadales bacterium]|nr:FtsX-like permease family protein [Gemmatimonadales bacterium]
MSGRPGPLAALRRVATPALWGLRADWGTAVLLVATTAGALAALLPVASLFAPGATGLAPRLGLAPWRGDDLGMTWSPLAASPTATGQAALVTLFRLLVVVAAGVFAVATVTVLSLSAARAAQRAREVSVRRAVGASRRHLLAAGLLESGTLAVTALVMGGVAGAVATRLMMAAWAGSVSAGTVVVTFETLGATVAGLILGATLPLVVQRRRSALPGPHGKPLELSVPAVQLGLSLTVLTAAALLHGRAAGLLVPGPSAASVGDLFEVTAPDAPPATRAANYRSLLRRLGASPRRVAVSLTSPGTLTGLGMVDVVTTDCGKCFIDGVWVPWKSVPATHYLVSADTFRALGQPVVAGRPIGDADAWGARRVAVVNRSLARDHFQHGAPVGRGIYVGRIPGAWYTVVGVVDDPPRSGFGAGLEPPYAVYLSVLQHPARSVDLVLRAPPDSTALAAVERGLRDTLGAGARFVHTSAAEFGAREAAPTRWVGNLFGLEGWVMLVIATVGTFAMMRLWVVSLRFELAVRRAVGARGRDILRFVLWRALGVAVGGVAFGLW